MDSVSNDPRAEMQGILREVARGFEKDMQCNCDLDNWEPTKITGHSTVCRIHKAAMEHFARCGIV